MFPSGNPQSNAPRPTYAHPVGRKCSNNKTNPLFLALPSQEQGSAWI